jgi:hypothetical protein
MNSAGANEVMSDEREKFKNIPEFSSVFSIFTQTDKNHNEKIPGTFGIVIQSSERNVFN